MWNIAYLMRQPTRKHITVYKERPLERSSNIPAIVSKGTKLYTVRNQLHRCRLSHAFSVAGATGFSIVPMLPFEFRGFSQRSGRCEVKKC